MYEDMLKPFFKEEDIIESSLINNFKEKSR